LRERRIQCIWWEQHKPRMRELGIPCTEAADFLNGLGYKVVPLCDCRADNVNWLASLR
jgi:hypothetical protein